MSKNIISCILILLVAFASSKGAGSPEPMNNVASSFSVSLAGALPFSSPQFVDFTFAHASAKIPPGLYGSIGIGYGPILIKWIAPTMMWISAEFSICTLNSEKIQYGSSHPQLKMQKMNSLIWTKFSISAPVSPFIRAGIGLSKAARRETYDSDFYQDIAAEEYTLALGLGAGLDIVLSSRITVSAFGDALFLTRDLPAKSSDSTFMGYWRAGATPLIGLRAEILL